MRMCDGDPVLFDLTNNGTIAFLDFLSSFNETYTHLHRYTCLVMCTIGVFLNSLHIIVLTRSPMRGYAINNILSVIALCDVLTMLSYLIYIIRFKIAESEVDLMGYSYAWLIFLMFHVVLSIALHTVSLYLCVLMAFVRWTALDRLDSRWVRSRSMGRMFTLTGLTVSILSIPTLIVHKIVPVSELVPQSNNNETHSDLYTVTLDEMALKDGCTIFKLNLWLTGICFKVIPCLFLLWFTVALMRKLCEMSRKRRMLRAGNGLLKDPAPPTPMALNDYRPSLSSSPFTPVTIRPPPVIRRKTASVDKTTVMLIIMLIVFLSTELPQGALAILNAIYTTDVHAYVYIHLGELLDLLSLVNCNVGFVLYCFMSSRYRITFRSIFCVSRKNNKSSYNAITTNNNNTDRRQSIYMAMHSFKNIFTA